MLQPWSRYRKKLKTKIMTLLTIDNHRIVTRSEESKLVKQKQWKETYSREKKREEFWRCRWSWRGKQWENKEKEEEDDLYNCRFTNVELPKWIITKFDGSHFDWFQSWNQFKSKIDNSNFLPVSKFSYFKEIVILKVHFIIDGLPFMSEG